ncbi:hypothetical protein MK280_13535, partial [Myxococcota bacterium]|nr:hypothetical protein [Myxococcota bacterium]
SPRARVQVGSPGGRYGGMEDIHRSIALIVVAVLGLCGSWLAVNQGRPSWLHKRPQKRMLRGLLTKRNGGPAWRKLSMLSESVGESEDETKHLLLEIGARASMVEGSEYWALMSRKPILRPKRVEDQAA